jgi:hypothetical protein
MTVPVVVTVGLSDASSTSFDNWGAIDPDDQRLPLGKRAPEQLCAVVDMATRRLNMQRSQGQSAKFRANIAKRNCPIRVKPLWHPRANPPAQDEFVLAAIAQRCSSLKSLRVR